MIVVDLPKLRAEFPDQSPAQLYDTTLLLAGRIDLSWEEADIFNKAAWLDSFANAPTSYEVH